MLTDSDRRFASLSSSTNEEKEHRAEGEEKAGRRSKIIYQICTRTDEVLTRIQSFGDDNTVQKRQEIEIRSQKYSMSTTL